MRRRLFFPAVILLAVGLLAGQTASSLAPRAAAATVTDPTPAQALATVAQFQGVWTSPPANLTGGETTDAPLLGNGDVGVAVGGSISDQTFYIGKNDFFSSSSESIEPLGRIVLALPNMAGASYHVVQNIAQAQVDGTYALNGDTVSATSWVSATEGMFVTSISVSGSTAQPATITLQNGTGGTPTSSTSGSVLNADVAAGGSGPSAQMSATVLGGSASLSGNQLSVTLQPGTTYTIATAIESSADTSSYQSTAQSMASSLTASSLANLLSAHEGWWQSYWSQSFVQIPDQNVEKSWYGSLYLLGSVSRAGKYAPGLWGNWITGSNMAWNGDYHTNYNYEAPFYAALSTNHIAQMGSYDAPVLAYMSAGEALASANDDKGVLYPVGILPNGGTDGANSLLNQKSDAVFLATDMVLEYEYDRSTSYANEVLPFLEQVGTFWQNYLTLSNGVYTDLNDAPQENDAYPQTNNAVSLAFVHLLFQGLIDMSNATGQNSSSISTWQNIINNLAPQPTTTSNGQTVFAETSQGAGFVNDGNDVDVQSVYPGQVVGLDSSSTLITEAQNTIGQLTGAWDGGNAPWSFYAAAARVGYNPTTIMSNLDNEATAQSYNNMAIHHNGGGIENINVTTSGLDEMLLQSFQNDVKVFPDWPSGSNARFGDLLAQGDFEVSSSILNNAVQYEQVISEAGGSYVFTNPWPGQSVEYYDNGTDEGSVSGAKITLSTTAGEIIDLAPAGTALATIQAELAGGEASYGGTAAAIPGTVQAENYDTGGQGAAYNVTTSNGTGTGYRSDGIDLETTSDTGGGYDLGWTAGGQWFKYTVNVAVGGTYAVSLRVAGDSAVTDALHIANAVGANLSGNINIPSTGGWQNWTTVTAAVTLPAGLQTLTLDEDNGGWNINYLTFANTGYSTSFETGQPQPTWTDTVDTTDANGGGAVAVDGICCGLTGPEAGIRTGETAHTGTASLMYSGNATAANAHAYMQVIDLSAAPLPVDANTVLTYWIYPQSNATSTWVPAGSTDSECVAVDMIFSDGSDLRDSGVKDTNGVTDHPADMCGHLTLDTWNQVTVDIGSVKSGLSIDKIILGYDQASGASGGYRGYFDDLSITG